MSGQPELDRVRATIDGDYAALVKAAAARPGDAAAQAAMRASMLGILKELRRIEARGGGGKPVASVAAPRPVAPVAGVSVRKIEIGFAELLGDKDGVKRFYFPRSDAVGGFDTSEKLVAELAIRKPLAVDGTGRGVIEFTESIIDNYFSVLDAPVKDDIDKGINVRVDGIALLLSGNVKYDGASGLPIVKDTSVGGLAEILRVTAAWIGARARENAAYERDADVMLSVLDWVLAKTTIGREFIAAASSDTGRRQEHERITELLESYYKQVPIPGVRGDKNQLLLGDTVPYTSLHFDADSSDPIFLTTAYHALLGQDVYAVYALEFDYASTVLGVEPSDDGYFNKNNTEPYRAGRLRGLPSTKLEVAQAFVEKLKDKPRTLMLSSADAKYLGAIVSQGFLRLSNSHTTRAADADIKEARFLYAAMFWFLPLQLIDEPVERARSAFARIGARPRAGDVVLQSATRVGSRGAATRMDLRNASRAVVSHSSGSTAAETTAAATSPARRSNVRGAAPTLVPARAGSSGAPAAAASVESGVTLDFVRDSLLDWLTKQASADAEEGAGLKQFAESLYGDVLGKKPAALEALVDAKDGLMLIVPSQQTLRSASAREAYVRTHVFAPVRSFEELYEGRRLTLVLSEDKVKPQVRVTARRSRFAQQRLVRIGDDPEQRVSSVIKLKRVRILVVDSWEPSESARSAVGTSDATTRMLLAGVRTGSLAAVKRACAETGARVPAYDLIEAYGEATASGAPADVRAALAAELHARGHNVSAIDARVRAAASTPAPAAATPAAATSELPVVHSEILGVRRRARRRGYALGAAYDDSDSDDEGAYARASLGGASAAAAVDAYDFEPSSSSSSLRSSETASRALAAEPPSRARASAVEVNVPLGRARTSVAATEVNVPLGGVRASAAAAASDAPAAATRVAAPDVLAHSSAAAAAAALESAAVKVPVRATRSAAAPERNAVIASFNRVLNKAIDSITKADADNAMFDAVADVHKWYGSNAEHAGTTIEPAAWAQAIESLRTSLEEKGCVDEASTAWQHVDALATLHRLA